MLAGSIVCQPGDGDGGEWVRVSEMVMVVNGLGLGRW